MVRTYYCSTRHCLGASLYFQSGHLGPDTIFFDSGTRNYIYTISVNYQEKNIASRETLRERRTHPKLTVYHQQNQQIEFFYRDGDKENPNSEIEYARTTCMNDARVLDWFSR